MSISVYLDNRLELRNNCIINGTISVRNNGKLKEDQILSLTQMVDGDGFRRNLFTYSISVVRRTSTLRAEIRRITEPSISFGIRTQVKIEIMSSFEGRFRTPFKNKSDLMLSERRRETNIQELTVFVK